MAEAARAAPQEVAQTVSMTRADYLLPAPGRSARPRCLLTTSSQEGSSKQYNSRNSNNTHTLFEKANTSGPLSLLSSSISATLILVRWSSCACGPEGSALRSASPRPGMGWMGMGEMPRPALECAVPRPGALDADVVAKGEGPQGRYSSSERPLRLRPPRAPERLLAGPMRAERATRPGGFRDGRGDDERSCRIDGCPARGAAPARERHHGCSESRIEVRR